MTVIDSLNQKGIMRGFHVLDQKKFKQWLKTQIIDFLEQNKVGCKWHFSQIIQRCKLP